MKKEEKATSPNKIGNLFGNVTFLMQLCSRKVKPVDPWVQNPSQSMGWAHY